MSRPLLRWVVLGAVVLSTAVLQYREVSRQLERQDAAEPLEPGVEAPPLEVERLGGGPPVGRRDLSGRVAIVAFWASWCVPCRAEMPEIARFVDGWNRDPARSHDALLVAVNVGEDPEEIRSITEDPLYRDVVFGLDPDGEAAGRWKAEALPSTFVVEPDGTVLDVVRGYRPNLDLRLRGLLGRHRSGSAG